MIKKTFEFVNIDDENETVDLYFNLTRNDFLKMYVDGFQDSIDEFQKNLKDQKISYSNFMNLMEQIIRYSYGVRVTDADGGHPRFIKNPDITKKFIESDVCEQFESDMFTDPKKVIEFITNIIPDNLKDDAKKRLDSMENGQGKELENALSKLPKETLDRLINNVSKE